MSDSPPTSKPPCYRADAIAVLRQLRDAGHIAYFAGGCVRDYLLGIESKDFDVATDATPDKVRKLFPRTQAVGAAFGVILVRINESVVEVATFRSDGEYLDGRRPSEVHFTTAEEDARRRDFTINGIFLDPLTDQVIDYVGGQKDLERKLIRAIGDPSQRFGEDYLRMLRAVRFAARFGFEIHPQTASAILLHAHQIKIISPERICEELRLMLTPKTRGDAFVLLRSLSLTNVIHRFLPEIMERRSDETFNIFLALDPPLHDGSISFGLALAGIILDCRMHASGNYDPLQFTADAEIKTAIRAMRTALKISNAEADQLAGAMSFHQVLAPTRPLIPAIKRFLAQPYADDARLLMQALLSCGLMRDRIEFLLPQLLMVKRQGSIAPPPLVTGDDLTAAGLRPGPVFKTILDAVYDLQLEDQLQSKDAALTEALRLAAQ